MYNIDNMHTLHNMYNPTHNMISYIYTMHNDMYNHIYHMHNIVNASYA